MIYKYGGVAIMKTFVISSLKGGTGKTNTCNQLCAQLSSKGYKVLCIDADPQHNLTKSMVNETPTKGLMELLNNECTIEDVIQIPFPDDDNLKNISLLPCNYELFFFEKDGNKQKPMLLRDTMNKAFDEGKLNYDFIFIDTNPAINLISTSAFIYGENIIGVLDASIDSLEGFKYLESTIIKSVQENVNPSLKIFGVVINNNDRRTNFSTVMLKTVIRKYGDLLFDTMINPSVKNKESRAARIPLVSYAPKHDSSIQFEKLANEFIERIGE
jgi:chromosome partitioning protein